MLLNCFEFKSLSENEISKFEIPSQFCLFNVRAQYLAKENYVVRKY